MDGNVVYPVGGAGQFATGTVGCLDQEADHAAEPPENEQIRPQMLALFATSPVVPANGKATITAAAARMIRRDNMARALRG
jgi:hypothetical protein